MELCFACPADTGIILRFIRELAAYEGMEDQVTATEELLDRWLFREKKAEVLLARENVETIGFALFFHNFSTFLGKPGIYLEDLYIRPEFRHRGYGKAVLSRLAALAVERGCGRLEWWCLDSNTPSIGFYLSQGAKPMSDWTVYRVTGEKLRELAAQAD